VSDASDGRLPTSIESGVYFLVSEALTNVVKHAHAGCAEVRLARDGAALAVEIRDDGVGGVAADQAVPARLADRVAALDGTLEVSSPPGRGTTLRAVVPVR
jgi:signal transduction histidine kinase